MFGWCLQDAEILLWLSFIFSINVKPSLHFHEEFYRFYHGASNLSSLLCYNLKRRLRFMNSDLLSPNTCWIPSWAQRIYCQSVQKLAWTWTLADIFQLRAHTWKPCRSGSVPWGCTASSLVPFTWKHFITLLSVSVVSGVILYATPNSWWDANW